MKIKRFSDLDLEDLKQAILKRYEDLLEENDPSKPPHFLAFWDFDGTILKGDITEGYFPNQGEKGYHGLMNEILRHGLLPEYPTFGHHEKFWAEYQDLLAADKKSAYSFLAHKVEKLPTQLQEKISKLSISYVNDSLKDFFFPSAVQLIEFLNSLSVSQFVISASPGIFVRAAKHHLPIPSSNIFGIHDCDQDGLFSPLKADEAHYGEGKATKVRHLLALSQSQHQQNKIRPLLAAGNSWTSDGAMCMEVMDQGGLGIMINLEENLILPESTGLIQAEFRISKSKNTGHD